MSTIVIVARTESDSLRSAQDVVSEVNASGQADRHYGLTDLRVTHYRDDSGEITPAGMGDQSVSEITTPPQAPSVDGGEPTMTQVMALLQSLAAEVAKVKGAVRVSQ